MVATQSGPATAGQAVVVDLTALTSAALPRAGGKAANLGELLRAGLPVPPGFCVTTEAYALAAEAAGLPAALAAGAGRDDAAALRERLGAVVVPPAVAAQVRAAYLALGDDVAVAVRSSATAEDLPGASFAGQQDTYLNVVGADAVLDAVRRCWASLWTDRAVSYRAAAGIDPGALSLAVVVQVMVDSALAGVLFTADPLTGTRTHTVIDAAAGLGEAVVSGAVNPDHIVVDATGSVLEYHEGGAGVAIRSVPGGGTRRDPTQAGAGPCLGPDQVAALVALGRRAEAHFGAPQDIEWAIDEAGRCWLTQSRPITTLFPLPAGVVANRVYFCISLAQGLVRPLTPMGIAGARVIASEGARLAFGATVPDTRRGPAALTTAAGRLFIDVTPALRSRAGRVLVPRVLDVMEARSATVLRSLFDDPAYAVVTSWWPVVRRVARTAVRFGIPLRLVRTVASPASGHRHARRVRAGLGEWTTVAPDLTGAQRVAAAQRAIAAAFPVLPLVAPVAGAGFVMLGLAYRLAGRDLGTTEVHEVLRSLPHNVTTEMDLELWALSSRLRADAASAAALRASTPAELAARFHRGELPAVLHDGLAAFLRVYGHRAAAEIDLGVPRWSDDPAPVLAALAGYLRLPVETDPDLAPDVQFARGARAADAAVAAVVERVRRRSRLRGHAVRFALGRVRALAGMREEHKDLLVRMLAAARAQLAPVGAELAKRGLLDHADDVYLLDLDEAVAALRGADLRVEVARRREDYDRELRRRGVPRVVLSDGTVPEAVRVPGATGSDVLTGTPASAGSVRGRVRVVLDPADARLEPGDVLVVPSTDPGWTPLFLTAGALVMEMGGSNSHGAVVAREYGIPAVVGVAGATEALTSGQLVDVDGAAGTVAPVAEAR